MPPPSSDPSRNGRVRNHLLAALPDNEYERLIPQFEKVSLTTKQLLSVEERRLEYAYFPENCVISVLARTNSDNFTEIATVGQEGMLGSQLLLGVNEAAHRSFSQIPGECLRISAEAFCEQVSRGGPFVLILHRYLQMLIVQVAQGAACNSRHTVEQRCARWLLMTHDRVGVDEFPLTQEFLCEMLGVRRATVSEVASRFQAGGCIRYTRGIVQILDRKGLERSACECYWIVRKEYGRPLLGPA